MKQNSSYRFVQTSNATAAAPVGASFPLEHSESTMDELASDSLSHGTQPAGAALIVEDHPLYRDALIRLLCTIVGDSGVVAASSAEEGLRSVANIPDLRLVLLDVGLPGLSGTEAVMAFRRQCPSAMVVVVSASEDRRDVTSAFRAGAHAFVSKAVSTEVLASAVRRILAGAVPKPEWIVSSDTSQLLDSAVPSLTPRQREILTLLSQGHTNKEIGLRLDLAEVTVKLHVSSIFRALGVTNRTQAVLEARRLALCQMQTSES